MELIQLEIENNIATISIQNGRANAISPQVISELNEAFDQSEKAEAVVIITGQAGIFSAGFDLSIMTQDLQAAVDLVCSGSKLSHRMMSFPFPIIAASSGHAIAKGAFLLLSCDYRIGCAGKFKIGLNEVAIGMTMHHAGIEIAKARISKNYLSRAVINAEIFGPQEATSAGFLDEVVEPNELLTRANEVALQMLQLKMKAHHLTKLNVRKQELDAIEAAIELDRTSITTT
jgi:enoyl-CoA hydratase/carnithine racemase